MHSSKKTLMLLTLSLFLLMAVSAAAQYESTPREMNYQGRLTDVSSNPVADDTYSVTFTIYAGETGSDSKWSEVRSVTTENGFFSILLGSVNPLEDSVFYYAQDIDWKYLGIKVGADPEMTPRSKLVAVPYAMKVATVNEAIGGRILGKLRIGSSTNSGADAFSAGDLNGASGDYSTVTGGSENSTLGDFSIIGSGQANLITIDGLHSTVVGGYGNYALASMVALGGGYQNRGGGSFSTVPGGYRNYAFGRFSFAAGRNAKATHDGTFVWGDSTDTDFVSTDYNQFLVRANGGVGINMNNPQVDLHVNGEMRFGLGSRLLGIREVYADGLNMFSDFISFDGIGIGSQDGANQQMIMFTDGFANDNIFTVTTSPDGGTNWYPRFVVEQGGHVGIGTDDPVTGLTVSDGSIWVGGIELGALSPTAGRGIRIFNTLSDTSWSIINAYDYNLGVPQDLILQETGGNVGIFTTSPQHRLDVNGTIGSNGTMYHSDRRWKQNIATLSHSLDKVLQLRGVSFDWNQDDFSSMDFPEGNQIGFIAQEVEEVVPEVVHTTEDGFKSLDYSKMVALLVEASKEQQEQIVSQQKQIDELKKLISKLVAGQ